MSSSVCSRSRSRSLATEQLAIATEAMAAYASTFIQVLPRHHQSAFPSLGAVEQQMMADLENVSLWVENYVAEHPERWWMVGEEKIFPVLSGLPLTNDKKNRSDGNGARTHQVLHA